MKCSDYVVEWIAGQGVAHIFEMIGGAIAHLVDSVYRRSDIRCVSMHHEQAAAFAAEGYARMNGRPGVAMATSGPGALNLLTGIGSCYFDSIPCLFITGQVNTYEYKRDPNVRQFGFQETDIVSVAKPLVKYAVMVADPQEIKYELEKAAFIARSGRPGPVLLDLPMNVQRADIDPGTLHGFYEGEDYLAFNLQTDPLDPKAIEEAAARVQAASRPLLLAGGGVRTSGALEEFRRFVEETGIPVVHSLMGLDALPGGHPASFGLIGAYGNRYGNLAIANCDLLLVLGSRLDSRQTGTRPDTFARAAFKIHVDIDPAELGSRIHADMPVRCGLRDFVSGMNRRLAQGWNKPDLSDWLLRLKDWRLRYPTEPREASKRIDPNLFMNILSDRCAEDDVFCLDVGQHQMWASQSLRLKKGARLLNAGGMGAMGFALPAAIGAALSDADRRVIVIAGDGGFQLNIQELETVVRLRLPLKMIVMNNHALGMVRQFQDMYFDGRQASTTAGYGSPDFVKVARAYGIPAFRIDRSEETSAAVDRLLAQAGPALLEVRLPTASSVSPKLAVGKPVEDMFPYLDREELRQNMIAGLQDDARLL